jgi:phage terminase large subunit-like protein
MHASRQTVLQYTDSLLSGAVPSSKWVFAAVKRWYRDLDRPDLRMDWDRLEAIAGHFRRLSLPGDWTGTPFELNPWQLWVTAQFCCWRWVDDGTLRTKLGMLQVARGNGKTTWAAGLGLFDFWEGPGRRVHVLANKIEQASLCVDAARHMARPLEVADTKVLHSSLERPEADCKFVPESSNPASLDGLTPSLWIADEAAEYRNRDAVVKLITTGQKRRNSLGVIISTPADNPDGVYAQKITEAEAVLTGEVEDDTFIPILYGLDPSDQLEDESTWIKANPNMPHGQPTARGIRQQWNTLKTTPAGRRDFSRFIAARMSEEGAGWLDMSLWPGGAPLDWASQSKRPAWVGVDLSKTLDMTAVVVAVPQPDGKVWVRGDYWWPSANVRQRELDYRLPVRSWAAEGRLTLTPGGEVDYESVRKRLGELREEFDLRVVGYDAWGASYLIESCIADGIPMKPYRMGVATMGPGCQLWQNLWAARGIVIGDDPILKMACRTAIARRDRNNNIMLDKASRSTQIIDPLVAAVIAVHCWGGKQASCYETEV